MTETVLVHCWSGISRSAVVVMAYLVAHHNMSVEQSRDFVLSKRPIVDVWPDYYEQFAAKYRLK